VLSRRAEREFHAVLAYISAQQPRAAQRLRDRFAAALEHIGRHPEIGTRREDVLPDPFRFWPVDGYPYLIVYNSRRRPPTVARFVHGARDLPALLRD
jgi:toxin ParE1/3/4